MDPNSFKIYRSLKFLNIAKRLHTLYLFSVCTFSITIDIELKSESYHRSVKHLLSQDAGERRRLRGLS